ncbi:MAG: alpha/beta fold hydrolase [Candidatus Komeilibacteria bacterium]|nr:alpha/beta fold hydrolase [Candidatus Komeilibacteria bacterium]
MKKRVIIVHGWDGYPEEGWFPWLKQELEGRGFEVLVPEMPDSSEPRIEKWVSHLAAVVGDSNENVFFVGHSIGCQAILRYMQSLPAGKRIGGAVFVAGWFTLSGLETDEEKIIAKPWLELAIDFEKVKKHCDRFFALFSDDDKVMPRENRKFFEERLGATTKLEHKKGHFSGSDGITQLPSALDALLRITG